MGLCLCIGTIIFQDFKVEGDVSEESSDEEELEESPSGEPGYLLLGNIPK